MPYALLGDEYLHGGVVKNYKYTWQTSNDEDLLFYCLGMDNYFLATTSGVVALESQFGDCHRARISLPHHYDALGESHWLATTW